MGEMAIFDLVLMGLVALFIVLLFMGVVWWVRTNYARIEKQFRLMAGHLELEYIDDASAWRHWLAKYPQLKGEYKGAAIHVFMEVRGSGKQRYAYTILHINCPKFEERGLAFQVYQESFFSKIGKALGMQDIELGSENFDSTFVVKGNDVPLIKQVLNNQAQRFLLANKDLLQRDIQLQSGILTYSEMLQVATDTKRERFETVIKTLVELVTILNQNV